jgi:hypothetical protein
MRPSAWRNKGSIDAYSLGSSGRVVVRSPRRNIAQRFADGLDHFGPALGVDLAIAGQGKIMSSNATFTRVAIIRASSRRRRDRLWKPSVRISVTLFKDVGIAADILLRLQPDVGMDIAHGTDRIGIALRQPAFEDALSVLALSRMGVFDSLPIRKEARGIRRCDDIFMELVHGLAGELVDCGRQGVIVAIPCVETIEAEPLGQRR